MTYAYEDPATLAKSARMVRTWLRRLAADEQAAEDPATGSMTVASTGATSGGDRDAAA